MKKACMLLIVMSFITCERKPQVDDVIFVDLNRPERASLFDYFHSIELIPLETSSDVLLVGISKMMVHDGKYYLCITDAAQRFKNSYYGKEIINFLEKDDSPLYEIEAKPYFYTLDKEVHVKMPLVTGITTPELTREHRDSGGLSLYVKFLNNIKWQSSI
jgi:hypothetical protein